VLLALCLTMLMDCDAGGDGAMLSRKFKKTGGVEVPFRKPKDPTAPTRHLYCCNCAPLPAGSADDWRRHSLVEACRGHAKVEAFFTVAGLPWAVLSFADSPSAMAAMLALQGMRLLGRPVHVQYTEAVTDRRPPAVASITCTSETRDVEIPGLVLQENFVSAAEEADILAQLDTLPWEAQMSRRVQHFGFTFDYAARRCSTPTTPFPACLALVAARALARGLLSTAADQCTVNEYLPGQGIRSHIDTHSAFHDGLLSVSLGSQVVMDFKGGGAWCSSGSPREGSVPAAEKHKAMVLPARSALAMHGAARYAWQHGIANRKSDLVDGRLVSRGRRVSLTLRAVRHDKTSCSCCFPLHCDSQQAQIPASRKDWEADAAAPRGAVADDAGAWDTTCKGGAGPFLIPLPPEIERKHVHEVYDAIAQHFSATRYKSWPRVKAFLDVRILKSTL
jgi:alkylated DNA repair protein alkB family protein 8